MQDKIFIENILRENRSLSILALDASKKREQLEERVRILQQELQDSLPALDYIDDKSRTDTR